MYSGNALVDFIADADAAIIGREWVDAAVIDRLSIRLLAKYGVGLDNIDQAALKQRGIALGWTPGVNAMAVAEQTVGFMIGLQRNLYYTARCMAQGDWIKMVGVNCLAVQWALWGWGILCKRWFSCWRHLGAEFWGATL